MFTMQPAPDYNWENEKKPAPAPKRAVHNERQILIIGQQENSLHRIKYMLEAASFGVTIKKSLSEGLSTLNFGRFDLIITEHASGGIDGKALLQNVKSRANTRVIILAVHQNEKEILSLYNHKADEVIKMPFGESEFMQRVRQLMPKRK
jgi:DNA-binding response OmpR family regulator